MRTLFVLAALTLGAGCATTDGPADPNHRQMGSLEYRAYHPPTQPPPPPPDPSLVMHYTTDSCPPGAPGHH
jgi:hypothetical protein